MSHDNQTPDPELLQTLFQLLSRFPTKTETLDAQTQLAADLNLDSVNMMELLMEIEDHFDVSLPVNMMANISTVQDLAEQIKKQVENRS